MEDNKDTSPLIVDSDRLLSVPSDHVLIYTEVYMRGYEPQEVEESERSGELWNRVKMRN